ncbi:MAG TPA: OmpA family protein [Steroidobacteraceae bacterium]|nr:OmpA family protein [Steroidobacteraceae bacterium]
MKHSRLVALAAAALLGSSLAHAGANVGSIYLSPELLWVNPDNQLSDAKDHTGFRAAVGAVLNQNWDLEAGYSNTLHSGDSAGRGDLSFRGMDITLNRVFLRNSRVNPFLGAGVTLISTDFHGTSYESSRPGAKVGGGVLVDLFGNDRSLLQLVGELGARFDNLKGYGGETEEYAALGLRLSLGGNSAAPLPVAAPPAPAPVPVVAPPPPPVAAAPPPPPAPPVDTDGDGVPDSVDRCPNTPRGDKVDAYGCGLTIALQVNFDTNSANINPDSFDELNRFVSFLKDVPSVTGTLEGHTDNVGKAAYNLSLSQRRADAVKAYVVGKGVDASRIQAKGYGLTRPIADNKTAEGRAQNRRVQFVRTSLQQ